MGHAACRRYYLYLIIIPVGFLRQKRGNSVEVHCRVGYILNGDLELQPPASVNLIKAVLLGRIGVEGQGRCLADVTADVEG